MTRRQELYPKIAHMRDVKEMKWIEIANELGLAKQTVCEYYMDPHGEQVWGRKHKSQCTACKAPTPNGSPLCGGCRRQERWQGWLMLIESFRAREGHAAVPQKHHEQGRALGAWVSHIRQSYNAGTLEAERIAELESIDGWSWGYRRL